MHSGSFLDRSARTQFRPEPQQCLLHGLACFLGRKTEPESEPEQRAALPVVELGDDAGIGMGH